jgi:hypothetical protein
VQNEIEKEKEKRKKKRKLSSHDGREFSRRPQMGVQCNGYFYQSQTDFRTIISLPAQKKGKKIEVIQTKLLAYFEANVLKRCIPQEET